MHRFRYSFLAALFAAGALAAAGEAAAPLVSVEPQRGIPGQTVVVTGAGFCGTSQCGPVSIQLYGAILAADVPVSPAGRFVRRGRVPGGAPTGEVGLIATQQAADGSELEAFATFEMAVRLRSDTTPKSKQAAEARGSSPLRESNRGAGPKTSHDRPSGDRPVVPTKPRSGHGDRAQAVEAAGSESGDGGNGGAVLALAATVLLLLGASLALVLRLRRR
jgi:hypothetical protein